MTSGLALAWGRALGEFGATLFFAGSLEGRTQTAPQVPGKGKKYPRLVGMRGDELSRERTVREHRDRPLGAGRLLAGVANLERDFGTCGEQVFQ